MTAIITLTTDFGQIDAYVAAIKGVILGINPDASVVDICHNIEPQNILQAAFVLSTAYKYFPPNTIHVVVIDPGVGTERRAIILKSPQAYFVAPDNGVLSWVVNGKDFTVFAINKPQFWQSPVSPTFHGRDIFAPVAARLSMGFVPSSLGDRVNSMCTMPFVHPEVSEDGMLVGRILHIDRFGNLITNITASDLSGRSQSINIEIGNHLITGIVNTYGEGKDLMALIGGSGYMEIALRNGSACALLKASAGDEIRVK